MFFVCFSYNNMVSYLAYIKGISLLIVIENYHDLGFLYLVGKLILWTFD